MLMIHLQGCFPITAPAANNKHAIAYLLMKQAILSKAILIGEAIMKL